MTAADTTAQTNTATICEAVLDQVDQIVIGHRANVRLILAAILAGGHVLIEDLPGLGKTLIARSLAQMLGLRFGRIQFTPDLLPGDITGTVYLDPATQALRFRPGPLFAQLVLADEINRAPAKTQSALLEAMAEGQVTVDDTSHRLPQPFIVLATDNPIEYEGTYPLPEAQLDRFTLRLRLGYLDPAAETRLLRHRVTTGGQPPPLTAVTSPGDVAAMRAAVDQIDVADDILDYIAAIADTSRHHRQVTVGASPRGALMLLQTARAHALLAGRDFVLPDDVKTLAAAVLAHRLVLTPEMRVRNITGEHVIAEILQTTQVPGGPASTLGQQ